MKNDFDAHAALAAQAAAQATQQAAQAAEKARWAAVLAPRPNKCAH